MQKKLLLISLLMTSNIYAQSCNIPNILPKAKNTKIDCINNTKADYYMLALSYSPQFCYKHRQPSQNIQCKDNKFEFIVHGLWPQKTNANNKCEHPRNCLQTSVDDKTIIQNLCIMPSPTLINQEWQKHGSCSFNNPAEYYKNIQSLWNNLNKPAFNKNKNLTVQDIKQEFIKINKNLLADNINVELQNKRFLSEVRICYDLKFNYKSCESKGAPDYLKVKLASDF